MTTVLFTQHAEHKLRSWPQPELHGLIDQLELLRSSPTLGVPIFTTAGEPIATATGSIAGSRIVYEVEAGQSRVLFTRRGDDIVVLAILRKDEDRRTGLQEVLTSVVTEVSSGSLSTPSR